MASLYTILTIATCSFIFTLSCSKPLEPLVPLTVISTTPSQQARAVSVTTKIILRFNRAITIENIQTHFSPMLKYPILANNSIYRGDDHKSVSLAYYEHEALLAGSTYTIIFTGIEDTTGALMDPYTLLFITQ